MHLHHAVPSDTRSVCGADCEVPVTEGSAEWFVGTNNSCYLDNHVKYM